MRRLVLLLPCLACGRDQPTAPAGQCPGLEVLPRQTFDDVALTGQQMGQTWLNRGPGFAVGDLDGDGDLDAFVALEPGPSVVLDNVDGSLQIRAAEADGEALPSGTGAAASDFDGDGKLDIALARGRNVPDLVLYGDSERGGGVLSFTAMALPDSDGESKTPSVADADGDGDLDLYITGFVPIPVPDQIRAGKQTSDGGYLYWNEGDSWTQEANMPQATQGYGYQGSWLDADEDGDADLYLANDYGFDVEENALLLNDGAGGFEVAEDCYCNLEMNGMGAGVGDVDGDGHIDLYITDIARAHLLRGDGTGTFVETTAVAGAVPQRENVGFGWGTLIADLDFDGHNDLATAYGAPWPGKGTPGSDLDTIHIGQGDGTFRQLLDDAGFVSDGYGRTMLLADLDGDARPELLAGGITFVDVWALEGGCPDTVALSLEGPADNPAGIGSVVDVTLSDGTAYRRWVWPSVTSGSSATELYLGLGGQDAMDLVVTWPDGGTTALSGAGPGRVTIAR